MGGQNPGQTEFTKCATEDWDNGKAQKRMESLLAGHYSDKDIQGVLSPVIVTKANAKEVFADDPERMELLK